MADPRTGEAKHHSIPCLILADAGHELDSGPCCRGGCGHGRSEACRTDPA